MRALDHHGETFGPVWEERGYGDEAPSCCATNQSFDNREKVVSEDVKGAFVFLFLLHHLALYGCMFCQ